MRVSLNQLLFCWREVQILFRLNKIRIKEIPKSLLLSSVSECEGFS